MAILLSQRVFSLSVPLPFLEGGKRGSIEGVWKLLITLPKQAAGTHCSQQSWCWERVGREGDDTPCVSLGSQPQTQHLQNEAIFL